VHVGPLGPIYLIILTPKQNKQNKSPHFALICSQIVLERPFAPEIANIGPTTSSERPISCTYSTQRATNHQLFA